jgi:hypothetical protein
MVAGLVATASLCVAAASAVPAKYEAKASLLLLPAPSANGDNALLGIGGLQPVADSLARAMTDSGVADDLVRAGAKGNYEVVMDPISKGPVLLITVTDLTPAGAVTTLRLVIAEVQQVLRDLQSRLSVPAKAQLDSTVLARDKVGKLVLKSRIRTLGGVVGLGLALTFGVIVFLDSRAQQSAGARRRAARARGPTAANSTSSVNRRSVQSLNGTPWPAMPQAPVGGSGSWTDEDVGPGLQEETVRLSRES